MISKKEVRENEVAFCGDVKSWADALFTTHPEWPFAHAKIEQYGIGTNKRSDLRIFRKGSKTPILAGEVKLPSTPEGRSPYDHALRNVSMSLGPLPLALSVEPRLLTS